MVMEKYLTIKKVQQLQQDLILKHFNNIMLHIYFVIQLNGVMKVGSIIYYLKVIGLLIIHMPLMKNSWIGGVKF